MRNGSGAYSLPVNTWNPATTGVSATVTDWQALINDIATAMQQSVSSDGQTAMTGNLAMGNNKLTGLSAGTATGHSLRWEQLFSQGTIANLASATTTDIGAQNTSFLNITGTTTITGFGSNFNGPRYLVFAGILTLTHSATLVIPGAANITTAANDAAIAIPITGGWQIIAYQKTSGLPVSTAGLAPIASPTFTGTPAGPTASAATSTTQLATTAFVQQEVPAASTTASGKVELATTAETQTGTDTARAITPAGLSASVLGFGQTRQDVTGSRAYDTPYTNSTGRPIEVIINATHAGSASVMQLTTEGVVISGGQCVAGGSACVQATIPDGETYKLTSTAGSVTINKWIELR